MRPLLAALLAASAMPATIGAAADAPSSRRLALVAGSNRGFADRVPLRYAVTDAERFARVVTAMGGVSAADAIVLREPTRRAFADALAALRARVAEVRRQPGRVEVFVYFSGHADEQGLMLGRELLPYRELRDAVGRIGADVGITILDACASGAITRLKGGRFHPAFLGDASATQGYAYLTSSSENEAAQESDRLGGAFFTHALLSGLRGGADVTGDGLVTLSEAYQFAFSETLAQTALSQAGAQHPTYDIKMAGTGDVVLTDLRQTSARLVLGADDDGRFFVLDANRQLVAELHKPQGRRVELGLEPGRYQVYFEQDKTLLTAPLELREGQEQELLRSSLRPARRLPTRRRGEAVGGGSGLEGASRFQITAGLTGLGSSATATEARSGGGSGQFTFLRWARPTLAWELTLAGREFEDVATRTEARSGGFVGALFGARYYPPLSGSLRPHLGAAAGPFAHVGDIASASGATSGVGDARLGVFLGGGADLFLGRHFTLCLDTGLTKLGGRKARYDLEVGLGWTWGRR